ncbi:MAG: serine/threonine protein kinase [Ignavibacteriae bacterium]|nr:serine/threonine protein kinase [Ignavibacteria bacterium]MBI3363972.1 serine/threonine protein kinase [Ignavibacteriota bacterium]
MNDRFTFEMTVHGTGGFAKVIRGRDNILERDIAVKVLDSLATKFPESDQERFRREARILAKLSHPNIPSIYDVDFSKGHFLIAFQFIEGKTLREILDLEKQCQLNEVKLWFNQIASALEHAHSLGVVHRDVKPSNIIISPDRATAYLVDFGIALTVEDGKKLTESGYVIGTPAYMSPEQRVGEELDYRLDIFSFAVTLYETLAGKSVPFAQYEAISALNETIPPQMDSLILECLLPKEKRLLTAKLFGQRLVTAMAPAKPLSEVLSHGKLHELQAALDDFSPRDMLNLPAGQRVLILAKVNDVVNSSDIRLIYAGTRFLELMLMKGILLPADDYREIVAPAIEWGFEREIGDRIGSDPIRRSLEQAAQFANGEAHRVMEEEVVKYLVDVDFNNRADWYLHSWRMILQTLLANPQCTSGSTDLVRMLRDLNRIQRTKRVAVQEGSSNILQLLKPESPLVEGEISPN